MKKIYHYLISGLALSGVVASCQKVGDDTEYIQDETLYRTGDVTLCLSVENMTTKLDMDDLGHFLFARGDSIAAVCTDGTVFKMYLSGTGDTKRAFFKGSVPAGKTLGDIVFYPCSYLKSFSHGIACIELPAVQDYVDGYNCPMVGRIYDQDFKVQMSQAASSLRLTIKSFPEDVRSVVFSDADGNALSGAFDCDICGSGIAAKKTTGDLKVVLDQSYTKPQFSLCVPYGDYTALGVTFYDKDGNAMSSQRLSESQLTFDKATLTRMDIESALIIKSNKVVINGSQTEKMTETSPDLYEVTFDAPASGEMVLFADGVECGFTPYSGAGGLGECKDVNSALPYYNFTDKHTKFYEVSKATGALYPIEEGGAKFWLNMDSPARVRAVMDLSYGTNGSYYFEVLDDDPDVIIDEGFDLFTCGGDQTWYIKGTLYSDNALTYDGLKAGTKAKAPWNASGSNKQMWDYPVQVNAFVANETYIHNRGVADGWIFQQVDERPGGLQVGESSCLGKVTTPAFSKLDGTSDVCFSIEMNRYSAGAASGADIYFVIKNGGKFTGGHAHQTEAEDVDGVHFDAIDADISGLDSDTYTVTQEYCMFHYKAFNESPYKSVSTFDMDIQGATPDTRIEIYAADKSCRFMIYDIKVVKK